jgi:hypothetical protein
VFCGLLVVIFHIYSTKRRFPKKKLVTKTATAKSKIKAKTIHKKRRKRKGTTPTHAVTNNKIITGKFFCK